MNLFHFLAILDKTLWQINWVCDFYGFCLLSRVRARFSILGCKGATSPLYKGRAPCLWGCHGCHKGATGATHQTRDPPRPSLFREGVCHWRKVLVSVDKFSREFPPNYHRKPRKVSSEAKNSLENFTPPMIPLTLKIVLFLTRRERSTQLLCLQS